MTDGRAPGWEQARAWVERLAAPGFGLPGSAVHPDLHPVDDVVAVTTDVRTALEGAATAHVALVSDAGVELLRPGFRPVWSPDGSRLAHLDPHGLWVGPAHLPL